jgi:hypothetical protein
MFLTYAKSLPSFDQHMIQLEINEPDESKVYVGFHEGFLPLAAKYNEYLASLAAEVTEAPAEEVKEVLVDEPTVTEDVKEEIVDETVDVPVVKRTRKASV